MPVRDGGAWLAEAVECILRQTLSDIELLVVDDHGSDGAVQALDRTDPRLRVLASDGHGVSAAFNTGLARAGGEFVARMDADDIALPERLERQVGLLRANPDIDICGACVEIFVDGDDTAVGGGNRRYVDWLNGCRSPSELRRALFIECPLPNPTALFRSEVIRALGGYADPDWPEDYDLFLRADARGMRMAKPAEILLRWREHRGRITHSDPRYGRSRFQAAKAHYLARGRLHGAGPVVIWGAGPGGRLMHDLLQQEGISVEGFLDVHPRRLGGTKRGLPVWPLEQIDKHTQSFLLVAVGAAGARREIQAFLEPRGRIEGEDYLFVL